MSLRDEGLDTPIALELMGIASTTSRRSSTQGVLKKDPPTYDILDSASSATSTTSASGS